MRAYHVSWLLVASDGFWQAFGWDGQDVGLDLRGKAPAVVIPRATTMSLSTDAAVDFASRRT